MTEPVEPLSLRFANSRYAVGGQARDDIDTPERLQAWLTRHTTESSPADVVAFAELRDAIRELFTAAIDRPGSLPEDAITLLNRLSADAPSWPALAHADGRFQLVERRTTNDARPTLAQDAIMLLGSDLARDLRACRAPGCVQFFLKDHPRREWCSTACGNRARAARHYLRHRGDPTA